MPKKAALGKQPDELLAITHMHAWMSGGDICVLKWCTVKLRLLLANPVTSPIAIYPIVTVLTNFTKWHS